MIQISKQNHEIAAQASCGQAVFWLEQAQDHYASKKDPFHVASYHSKVWDFCLFQKSFLFTEHLFKKYSKN